VPDLVRPLPVDISVVVSGLANFEQSDMADQLADGECGCETTALLRQSLDKASSLMSHTTTVPLVRKRMPMEQT
jgi:hypothetical protein